MKNRMIVFVVIAAMIGFGFTFMPKPKALEVDVTTRIEMIGGHQYAIAISTTAFGYDSKSSIAMVHHEGCTTCAREKKRLTMPRGRPPVAEFYPGQI